MTSLRYIQDALGKQRQKRNGLKTIASLAGVAQWIEHQPANQRVASLIPSQGTCLGCGLCALTPSGRLLKAEGNRWMFLSHIDVSLPLFLPPFPTL